MNADFQPSNSIDSSFIQTKPAASTTLIPSILSSATQEQQPTSNIASRTNNTKSLLPAQVTSRSSSVKSIEKSAILAGNGDWVGELYAACTFFPSSSASSPSSAAVAIEPIVNRGSDARWRKLNVMNTERPTTKVISSTNNNNNKANKLQQQEQPKRIHSFQIHYKDDSNNNNIDNVDIDATTKTSANQLNKPSSTIQTTASLSSSTSLAGINRISDCVTETQREIPSKAVPEASVSTNIKSNQLRTSRLIQLEADTQSSLIRTSAASLPVYNSSLIGSSIDPSRQRRQQHLCNICHQGIPIGLESKSDSKSEEGGTSWSLSASSDRATNYEHQITTSSNNQLTSVVSGGLICCNQQGQQLRYCQRCLISSFEEGLQLDHKSSHKFWRFISNLPKSILQRRKRPFASWSRPSSSSSSLSNLNQEVLGYLERFAAAASRVNNNNNIQNPEESNVQINNLNNMKSNRATTKQISSSSSSIPHQHIISSSSVNTASATLKLEDHHNQQQQQRASPSMMNKSASANLDSSKVKTSSERVNKTHLHSTELEENVQLQECRPLNATGNGPKIIKISSPSISSEQAVVIPSTSSFNNNNSNIIHKHNIQQGLGNKLSIATSLTTRSSVSSISSCILSSSSTSEVRLKWGKKMDFLLSIIGFAVDLANIWRFPYLVYKNGGGVFFIPYIIMLIFGGIPLFFLELCLGQFVKKGPITVWNKICPSMKGVGYCSILVSWYVSFYYNVLIAWSVYFIYRSISSFGDKMPWQDCDNEWNSKTSCVSIRELKSICLIRNDTIENCRRDLFSSVNVTSPASEFFVKELSQLDQSSGFDDIGYLRPELAICLVIVYLLHYLSLFRGLETSGKVVWVTATAPYIILSILLIRGLFLPGASMGVAYYLSPKLERLKDPIVWIDAAVQVFYSIGVGFGVHLTYASFNSHNNNCHRDCLMTSAVNAITSVYSGLVVFVYLGYMAQNLGIEIDKVANEGYGLIFEVYPEALTTLPFARFWSILFFIMLLTLGIDSAMGGLESVITGLEDEFKFAKRLSRGQLTGLVIISSFLPALISCTQGGAYTIFWLDIYSAGVSLLFSALFETIGVVYCYGLKKFIPNVESMLGKRPNMFYLLCWKYISPLFLILVIVMSILTAPRPIYRNYTFPTWSIVLGWILAFSSVAVVPFYALWYLLTNQKSKSRITSSPDRRKKTDRNSVVSSFNNKKQQQLQLQLQLQLQPTNYTPVSNNFIIMFHNHLVKRYV